MVNLEHILESVRCSVVRPIRTPIQVFVQKRLKLIHVLYQHVVSLQLLYNVIMTSSFALTTIIQRDGRIGRVGRNVLSNVAVPD